MVTCFAKRLVNYALLCVPLVFECHYSLKCFITLVYCSRNLCVSLVSNKRCSTCICKPRSCHTGVRSACFLAGGTRNIIIITIIVVVVVFVIIVVIITYSSSSLFMSFIINIIINSSSTTTTTTTTTIIIIIIIIIISCATLVVVAVVVVIVVILIINVIIMITIVVVVAVIIVSVINNSSNSSINKSLNTTWHWRCQIRHCEDSTGGKGGNNDRNVLSITKNEQILRKVEGPR